MMFSLYSQYSTASCTLCHVELDHSDQISPFFIYTAHLRHICTVAAYNAWFECTLGNHPSLKNLNSTSRHTHRREKPCAVDSAATERRVCSLGRGGVMNVYAHRALVRLRYSGKTKKNSLLGAQSEREKSRKAEKWFMN